MFTPIKPKDRDVLNDTVLNTPQPQASSTVCGKAIIENKLDNTQLSKEKDKQDLKHESEPTAKDDISLGLLEMSDLTSISAADEEPRMNYSNLGYSNAELEYARKLLQKCSNINSSLTADTNKENNVNVQNITGSLSVSNFTLPLIGSYISELDKECTNHSINKITFEPNEISAHSSTINTSTKRQSPENKSISSNYFSEKDVLAQLDNELMVDINKEEFLSGSKMIEQLSIDEACWQQNHTYCMSFMNSEKHKVNFDSFSGVFGELDLSTESNGQKVSVDQYFKRKSDDIGILGSDRAKPSLGILSETPVRRDKLSALAESNTLINATMSSTDLAEKESTLIPNALKDTDENSVISLNTIVNTLQDINSGTPRRLVDQLLMAQKKKKHSILQESTEKETYSLPFNKMSALAVPVEVSTKFNDTNVEKPSMKLSLDSEIKNETADKIDDTKQKHMKVSFPSNEDTKKTESYMNPQKKIFKKEVCKTSPFNQNSSVTSTSDFVFPLQKSTLPSNDKLAVSNISFKVNKNYNEESYNDLNIPSKEIKEKDSSNDMTSVSPDTNVKMEPDLSKNVVFGENTKNLCNCIVGMTNEVNVELINNGNRWITYNFKLNEVGGDAKSIKLNMPSESILIKPNGCQSTKIEIKVIKMCRPIFIVLNIFLSDMVAKSKWSMKHMIFVNPEELDFDIMYPSDKQELQFQYILEETKVLPIILHNKNNVDVPVKLFISQDGSKIFSISEPTHLILKSFDKFVANVKCGKSRAISIDSPQRQSHQSKLIISVPNKDETVLFRKEVPLYVQMGICKIQLIDTEVPIVIPRQQGKLIKIVNSGNVATHVSVIIMPIEEHTDATQDFCIKPENIFLQVGEKSSFLIKYKPQFLDVNSADDERYAKIKLVAGNNVYYYIISTEQRLAESEKESLRCHTPNNVVSLSPATSPQSVTSTRSGPCDRNSPISTVSSVAIAGNAISLKATHSALVWNSVKTGKSETKELTIRNMSNNKIKIQIDICDDSKSFKFLGDKHAINTSMVLAMQRQESKVLAVTFSPYYVGPVVGKITIKHYTRESNDPQQYVRRISLYGYGGYSKVKITGTFKDASGKMWLSLGNLYSETTTLSANITLDNGGDLRSFAKITVIPKIIFPTMNSSWNVNPKEFILNSKESQQVTIQFHPKKEDFALLQRSEVSHVATINITYGDEPTRWRIRRLYNKIKESNKLIKNENEAFTNIVQPICKVFPGEHLIPDLTSIRDSVQNLSDLCVGVHQSEIMLTVEACVDDTLPVHYDTDESEMFQSLISDTTNIDEEGGASFFVPQTMVERDAQHSELQDQFTVTPSTIVLTPPIQNEATVTVLSFFKTAEPFQTNLSHSDYFSVVPAEGMLPSKKSFFLKIQCSQRIERNMQAVLEIYTENHKQDVLIKIVKRQ